MQREADLDHREQQQHEQRYDDGELDHGGAVVVPEPVHPQGFETDVMARWSTEVS